MQFEQLKRGSSSRPPLTPLRGCPSSHPLTNPGQFDIVQCGAGGRGNAIRSTEKARVHHVACRSGSVAACRARTAARADAAHWRTHDPSRRRSIQPGPGRSVPASLATIGLERCRNVRIDIRRNEDDADRARRYAQELVALAPDIFLASGTLSVTALQHVTRTLPIVFANRGRSGRRGLRR